jgi:hypothetical protein
LSTTNLVILATFNSTTVGIDKKPPSFEQLPSCSTLPPKLDPPLVFKRHRLHHGSSGRELRQ